MNNSKQLQVDENNTQAGLTQVKFNPNNAPGRKGRPNSLRPGRSMVASRSLRPGGQLKRLVRIKNSCESGQIERS